jgi:hypothetical protein
MSGSNGSGSPDRDAADDGDAAPSGDGTDGPAAGDTFGVGIHVTDAEFQFVVHVPSDIDSGWTDPEAFQRVVERAVWNRLDRAATLREIGANAAVGETVTLGRVTLTPDGTVHDAEFDADVAES